MKVSKKILSLVLAFVCAVSVVAVAAPTQVYAAKTKEITLIKGEKISYNADNYNVKSVSSDKKSVVSVKKNEDESTEIVLTAKEKGTANVTVKTERGTKKYKVTVVGNAVSFNGEGNEIDICCTAKKHIDYGCYIFIDMRIGCVCA